MLWQLLKNQHSRQVEASPISAWPEISSSGGVPHANEVSAQASGRPVWRCQMYRRTGTPSGFAAGRNSGKDKARSDTDNSVADSLGSSGCTLPREVPLCLWALMAEAHVRCCAAVSKRQAPP